MSLDKKLNFFQKMRNKKRTNETRKFIEARISDTYMNLQSHEEKLKIFLIEIELKTLPNCGSQG